MLYQCIVGELHPLKSEGKFTQSFTDAHLENSFLGEYNNPYD